MRLRLLTALLAVLGILVIAACGDDDDSGSSSDQANTQTSSGSGAAKGEPIVIGAAIAETGFLSIFDVPAVQAMEVAIEDINANGGVNGRPLELKKTDMKSDREQGSAAALRMIDEKAAIGVVSCDLDFGSPAAIEFAKKEIVSFSLCAGAPDYGPRGVSPYAFSAGVATPNEAAGGAEWAAKEKGWKNVYTLADTLLEYDTTWIDFFGKTFTANGGKIVGHDTYTNDDPSVQTQLAKLKGLNPQPDAIAICGTPPGTPAVVRQIRAAGIQLPIVMCVAMEGKTWLPSVPGLKDAFFTSYGDWDGNDPNERVNELFTQYKDKFDEPNSSHPLEGFGLVDIIKTAVEKAGTTDGPKLKETLEGFKDVDVTSGCTTFDQEWHISFCRPIAIKEIKDQKFTYVTTVEPTKVFYPE
jgi:branched-chain amino acid transport system substrate-binding protein